MGNGELGKLPAFLFEYKAAWLLSTLNREELLSPKNHS